MKVWALYNKDEAQIDIDDDTDVDSFRKLYFVFFSLILI